MFIVEEDGYTGLQAIGIKQILGLFTNDAWR